MINFIAVMLFIGAGTAHANQRSSQAWPSEYPDLVNKFIYNQTHAKCAYSDYIDGIIAYEVTESISGRSYSANFSLFGDVDDSFINVDENLKGELVLSDLVCPRP